MPNRIACNALVCAKLQRYWLGGCWAEKFAEGLILLYWLCLSCAYFVA
jgi:hypothetical protein